MGQVGGDTWCVHNIVEGEVVDERAGLEEERQWLANATTCAGNDYSISVCGDDVGVIDAPHLLSSCCLY